jgi:hypothetical protein
MRGICSAFSMFKTSHRSKEHYVKPSIQYLNSLTSGMLLQPDNHRFDCHVTFCRCKCRKSSC